MRIDDKTIRLAVSHAEALDAQPIDLTPPSGLQGDSHTLTPDGDCASGVCISSYLDATNAIAAAATLAGTSDESKLRVTVASALSGGIGNLEELIGAGKAIADERAGKANSGPTQGTAKYGVAGAVAVNFASHDVETTIHSTAKITSDAGIDVSAEIDEKSQVASTAGATKPKKADASAAVAVAIGAGIFENTAKTTIESGAKLDAHDTVALESTVSYPILVDDPWSVIDPLNFFKSPDSWSYFNDGTLGYSSNLFNTWVMTAASEAKVAIGVSIAVNDYVNVAKTTVEDGVQINQKTGARFDNGGRGVSLKSNIDMTLISIVGVMGLSLNIVGLAKLPDVLKEASGKFEKLTASLKSLVNPFGAEGSKGGIGASLLVELFDNTAESAVSGATTKLHAGTDGLTIGATTSIYDFALAQAGSKASAWSISGAFAIGLFTNRTTGHMDAGVALDDGGALSITAGDSTTRTAIAGAITAGKQVGVGISFGYTGLDRTTRAYVGRLVIDSAPAAGTQGTVSVAKAITISADVSGTLLSVVLGGAVAGVGDAPPAQKPTTPAGGGADLTAGVAVSVAVNSVTADTVDAHLDNVNITSTPESLSISATSEPTIIAIVIAAAVNVQKDSAKTKPSVGGFSLDLAVAGAIAVDDVHANVSAVLSDSVVTTKGAGGIAVLAGYTPHVEVDAGGVAVVLQLSGKQGTSAEASVGASVAVNAIDATVTAKVQRSSVDAEQGDVTVMAYSAPAIIARTIAGALTVDNTATGSGNKSISIAAAGAGSGNSITTNVSASIEQGSHVTSEHGGTRVRAVDGSTISADAGGFAVSITVAKASKQFLNLAIGLSAAVNTVENTVGASVSASTVIAGGALGKLDALGLSLPVSPNAIEVVSLTGPSPRGPPDCEPPAGQSVCATIEAVTIAGAGASGAGAGAGSGNYIGGATNTSVTSSTLTATGLAILVSAAATPSIYADAGGIGVGLLFDSSGGGGGGPSVTLAVGIGIAVNRIGKDNAQGIVVHATVSNSVVTGGSVAVTASTTASINAYTFGVAVEVAQSNNAGVGFAGGVGGSFNTIRRGDTKASVEQGSSIVAATTVMVLASDTSTITADGGGFAIGLKFGKGNGFDGSVGVGVSCNEIGSDSGCLPPSDRTDHGSLTAQVDASDISAGTAVTVQATAAPTVSALTLGGALSGNFAQSSGLDLAGGGAGAVNRIVVDVLATIARGTTCMSATHPACTTTTTHGTVTVKASDTPIVTADTGGFGILIKAGQGDGVNLAFGIAVSINNISDSVKAVVSATRIEGDAIDVEATTPAASKIDALTLGGALLLHIGTQNSNSLDLSLGVVVSINSITNTVSASAEQGANLVAHAGNVDVKATDDATIIADGGGFALTIGVKPGGGNGASVSVGVAFAQNTITNTVSATIDHSLASATGAIGRQRRVDEDDQGAHRLGRRHRRRHGWRRRQRLGGSRLRGRDQHGRRDGEGGHHREHGPGDARRFCNRRRHGQGVRHLDDRGALLRHHGQCQDQRGRRRSGRSRPVDRLLVEHDRHPGRRSDQRLVGPRRRSPRRPGGEPSHADRRPRRRFRSPSRSRSRRSRLAIGFAGVFITVSNTTGGWTKATVTGGADAHR